MNDYEYFHSPRDGMSDPSQGYPQHDTKFISLGGARHRESEVPSPRAQRYVLDRARNGTARSGDERTNHNATAPPNWINRRKSMVYSN